MCVTGVGVCVRGHARWQHLEKEVTPQSSVVTSLMLAAFSSCQSWKKCLIYLNYLVNGVMDEPHGIWDSLYLDLQLTWTSLVSRTTQKFSVETESLPGISHEHPDQIASRCGPLLGNMQNCLLLSGPGTIDVNVENSSGFRQCVIWMSPYMTHTYITQWWICQLLCSSGRQY